MIKTITKLVRLEQWYKNAIILAPLLFAPNVRSLSGLAIGFLGFCCVSSMTYMINDWMDREKDRLHPIKKERPFASGKIKGKEALAIGGILLLIVAWAVWMTNPFYGWIVGSYFIITNLYSFGLKNIPLLDILIIAANFALRMMSGVENLPDGKTMPYFILLAGVIIVFLTHKRRSDIKLLGEKAVKHKPVLKFYTKRNDYIFRAVGYLMVVVALYFIWNLGFPIWKIGGFYMQLFITSIIFSENPEFTSKAQMLFKSKLWTGTLIANIILFILT